MKKLLIIPLFFSVCYGQLITNKGVIVDTSTLRNGFFQPIGNYAIADSTLWQTKFRTDSMRNNIYLSLAGKQASLSGTGLLSFSGTTPSYNTTSTSISGIISDELGSGKMIFSAGTLDIASGKTLTSSNTLTLSGTDGSTLNISTGGTLGTNAFNSTSYAPIASPVFTGVVTIPTPFTLGATSVTSTGTQLNYLNAATGTTGTTSTNLVYSTSPTLVTPTLGVATVTSINKITLTQPATGSTLSITDGKTLDIRNSMIFIGTDAQTYTYPVTSATLARTDAAQTFTGNQTFSTAIGAIFTTNSTQTSANLTTGNSNALTGAITAAQYITNSNNIQYRVGIRGSSATVATVGDDVFALAIGDNVYTEATSGTSALGGGLYVKTQSFTNGSGATTDFQNAYIGDAPTGGVNNWSINAGASKFRGLLTVSGGIFGTATNDNATAGNVGEEFNSAISTYTNFTTTATYQNITSITLSAGDWDLSAFFTYSSNSSTITAASNAIFVVSTTTASASGATEGVNISYVPQAALLGTSKFSDAIPSYRVSISGSTTYYLNAQATFTIGNPQYVGSIRARRIR